MNSLFLDLRLVWSQWDTVIFLISMSHHLSSNFDINVPNLSHLLNPGFPTYGMKGHSCSCILLFPLKDNNTDSIKYPSAQQHIFTMIKVSMKFSRRQGVSHLTQKFDIKCPSPSSRILISSHGDCPTVTILSVVDALR